MTKSKTKAAPSGIAPDKLRVEYVPLATAAQWEKNPKKHDAGAIWKSIQQHGFKDPPKYEAALNSGKGGIVEGNGRTHVLREMQIAGEEPPRGIIAAEGDWLIPILFGVDADSERAAEAYGVDHNNLVLSGGDFSNTDFAKLWDAEAYAELLSDLAQFEMLPVSVDGEDVDDLIARLTGDGDDEDGESSFHQTQKITKTKSGSKLPKYGVLVICEGDSDEAEMYRRLRDEGYDCRPLSK